MSVAGIVFIVDTHLLPTEPGCASLLLFNACQRAKVLYRNRSKYQPKGHFDMAVGGRRRQQKAEAGNALEQLRQHRLQQNVASGTPQCTMNKRPSCLCKVKLSSDCALQVLHACRTVPESWASPTEMLQLRSTLFFVFAASIQMSQIV